MNEKHPSGLPSPQEESQPVGFTAVNGDARQATSRTPTESIIPSSALLDKRKEVPERASRVETLPGRQSHVTELDPNNGAQDREQDVSSGKKRKRADSRDHSSLRGMHVDTSTTDTHERGSPKRRHVQTIADSAIDLTSPDNDPSNGIQLDLPSERTSVGPHEREPSPAPRRNQKEPPPKPTSETEASLVESVRKFQETQQASENRQSQPGSSPEDEDDDDDDGDDRGDGPVQGGNYDPKKRKRNFSNRTKTGCHTCRRRKKKCDEGKPTCKNCDRGGFACQGYGPKTPGEKVQVQVRHVMPLQSKGPPYEAQPGPSAYFPPPPPMPHPPLPSDGRPYSTWYGGPDYDSNRRPWEPPPHPRPTSQGGRDDWGRPTWSYCEPRPLSQPPPPLFTPDHVSPAAFHSMPPPGYPSERPPLPIPMHPPAFDNWNSNYPSYRHSSGPPSVVSSRESVSGANAIEAAIYFAERDKMLSGKSFKWFAHGCIQEDMVACQAAVSEYNLAATSVKVPPATERAKMFNRILDKMPRTITPNNSEKKYPHHRPTGDIGDHTIVQTPFWCDFGWHIHLGEDCVVGSNCTLQDAGGIYIGDQVTIGPNVTILTMTREMKIDASQEKGSLGLWRAGMVKIEDNVEIGACAVILPYVTIGKNARVEPGAVVTKDVKAGWIVAGNPAVRIHDSDEYEEQQNKVIKHMEEMMAKHNWKGDTKPKKMPALLGDPKALFPLNHLK